MLELYMEVLCTTIMNSKNQLICFFIIFNLLIYIFDNLEFLNKFYRVIYYLFMFFHIQNLSRKKIILIFFIIAQTFNKFYIYIFIFYHFTK
jgi:hypothetical protein